MANSITSSSASAYKNDEAAKETETRRWKKWLKKVLGNLPRFCISLSGKRLGRNGQESKNRALRSKEDSASEERGGRRRRIKVVVTRQQLQLLLTKQMSAEQLFSVLRRRSLESLHERWKPELEFIHEGDEL
ncbi:PREDICTED: uncharacterized protein LOC104825194 [Tarenaya hassleriana]|uniref:uncharacterized protein LOC104825194 n=1 Tax=Tarenaya hassleriana TaxID=28532 RepID=UPI00053C631E|nr:PREDICTED: uncharacterized protein LOC104825194 [Tarenaya hassleriana]